MLVSTLKEMERLLDIIMRFVDDHVQIDLKNVTFDALEVDILLTLGEQIDLERKEDGLTSNAAVFVNFELFELFQITGEEVL